MPRAAVLIAVVLTGSAAVAAAANCVEVRDTLALFCQGNRVGTLIHASEPEKEHGNTVESTALTALNWMNASGRDTLVMEERRVYGADGLLINAAQSIHGTAGATLWDLRKSAGEWVLATSAGGVSRTRKIGSLSDNNKTSCAVCIAARNRMLKAGDSWTDTTFDMTSGTAITTTTACVGTQDSAGLRVYRLTVFDDLSRRKQQWIVDDQCHTILQEIPPAFVAQRSLAAPRPAHDSPEGSFTVKAERGPANDETLLLSLESADLLDDSIRVFYRKDSVSWRLLPLVRSCRRRDMTPVPDSLKSLLKPTLTIQSDHPEIRALAAGIVGGKKSACDAVAALTSHVFRSLKKRNTATYSNAVETLHAGFGDCGEHAVLLAALLRASGIPCRVVLGMVYAQSSCGYAYHAWVAIPSRTGWLFADPAFGQFPATNTLVPLLFDDQGRNGVYLARLLGRITIGYRQEDKKLRQ
jgi:hypothetical protein